MYKSRELLQMLEEIKENLNKALKVKERAVSKAPNGCLRISRRGKKIQYYQIEGNTGTHGKYLRKKSETLVKALAQKTYDRKLIALIKKQLELINNFTRQELFTGMDNLYRSQSPERKRLIAPLWTPDDEYRDKWESYEFTGLAFRADDTSAFYTEKGERVRSKSEVLIANALHKHKIPYRYECPYQLSSGRIVYPDFTILNLRERKELFWEHFGMLDDPYYREGMLDKMEDYITDGIFLGDQLIVTGETSKHALRMKILDPIINQYCK